MQRKQEANILMRVENGLNLKCRKMKVYEKDYEFVKSKKELEARADQQPRIWKWKLKKMAAESVKHKPSQKEKQSVFENQENGVTDIRKRFIRK